MCIRDPQTRHRWLAGRSTRSRSGGMRAEVRAIPHLPEIQRQPPLQTDYQTVSFAILEKFTPTDHGSRITDNSYKTQRSRTAEPVIAARGQQADSAVQHGKGQSCG